jgi:AraC-like DNA-binding protein/quercetin dioxygenase-like cupin family protein
MKAAFESVYHLPASSFTVRKFEEEQFSAPYHYHPEFELTYIVKGQGKRYIGSRVDDYRAGDLVLLGENLPHCWKTDNIQPNEINAVSIVIHFRKDFLGEAFFTLPELRAVSKLLELAMNGLVFKGPVVAEVQQGMQSMLYEQNGLKRIALFLHVLSCLTLNNEYTVLEKQNLYEHIALVEREKINKVTAFVVEHFREPIHVEQAAAIVHMTPHAFCKYFKRITRKTFIGMVIDYRIDHAAQQLVHSDLSITQIAFDSGFSDLSNFYRTFRAKKKFTPLSYRKSFS